MAKPPNLDPSIQLVKMRSKQSLAESHPDLAKEAHGWNPELVSGGSEQKLPWKCSLGHIFQALPSNRTRAGSGCPYCAGKVALPGFNDLATLEPEIAKQAYGWNPTEITAGSGKKMDWICSEGHIWNAQVSSRKRAGCPFCAGQRLIVGINDLATKNPLVAVQLRSHDPQSIMAHSNIKCEWQCQEGHLWWAPASDRMAGQGCPTCAKFGFKDDEAASIYFLSHSEWGLLQIGISNDLQRRLQKHISHGWEVLDVLGPIDGLLARNWEKSILRLLHKSGAIFNAKEIAGAFSGYTESWLAESFPSQSIRQLMRCVRDEEE